MKIEDLSKKYKVRRLSANDIEEVYHLCSKNTMYYEYCPPFITMEGVKEGWSIYESVNKRSSCKAV